MRKFASVFPAIAILAIAATVRAGVVIDEQQVVDQPDGNKVTRARVVMIEGDKQKSIIDNGNRTIITDLDRGIMTVVDAAHKAYVELPFPPKGAGMGAIQGGFSPTISFKKTGGHDNIIGYSCDNYSGAGTVGGNNVTVSGCFSDSAPGAADYSHFQRDMAEKVKGTPMANMGQIPPGAPLRLTIATTMGNPAAAVVPDPAKQHGQVVAPHQIITNTTISRISTRSLPPDSFQVPPGYRKQQLPPMFGGMGGAAPPSPPARAPE